MYLVEGVESHEKHDDRGTCARQQQALHHTSEHLELLDVFLGCSARRADGTAGGTNCALPY